VKAYPEEIEANPEETEPKVAHQVLKKDAAVKPVGALKWYRGWHLAAGCCLKPKEWTQDKDECRKKLPAARRRMTCHARVGTVQGTSSSVTWPGQCCARSPERTDVREEKMVVPGRQH
jgi:hypothetical protein